MDSHYRETITRGLSAARSRRQVLGAATGGTLAGIGATLLAPPGVERAAAQETATPTPETGMVHVRPRLHGLAVDGDEMKDLIEGIRAMKDRDDDDPTSWIYQANLHGTRDPDLPGPPPIWNRCEHSSFFFFSWHRMYLYWFERILRKASKNPNFALPYWDYSAGNWWITGETPTPDDIAQRVLPLPFREPADEMTNPLYVAERDAAVNRGDLEVAANTAIDSVVMPLWALHPQTFANFFHDNVTTFSSFGGALATMGFPLGGDEAGPGGGQVENTPHDQVHGWVGGRLLNPDGTFRGGWMSSLRMAARDPVFYLHHANIDRLWQLWLDLDPARADPTDNAAWMGHVPTMDDALRVSFTFVDEDGHPVEMSGKDIVDTVNQLGYRYEPAEGDLPPPPPEPASTPVGLAGAATPTARQPTVTRVTAAEESIPLGSQPSVVPVALGGAALSALDATPAPGAAESRAILTLEGVSGAGVPGVTYQIYLNLPPGETPTFRSVYFVGNLSLFGRQPWDAHAGHRDRAAQNFDVTHIVRELQARGEWSGQFDVTFVPVDLAGLAEAGEAAAAAATPEGLPELWASVGRVTVTAIE